MCGGEGRAAHGRADGRLTIPEKDVRAQQLPQQ